MTILLEDIDKKSFPNSVTRRTSPKDKTAQMGTPGTISRCLGGDIIMAYIDGDFKEVVVAWSMNNGDAMVRIDGGQTVNDLKLIAAETPVEWIEIRPK